MNRLIGAIAKNRPMPDPPSEKVKENQQHCRMILDMGGGNFTKKNDADKSLNTSNHGERDSHTRQHTALNVKV